MAVIKDRQNESPPIGAPPPLESGLTPDEKELLCAAFERHKKPQFVNRRTARLLLIAAAFGLLAAVCAIRLFPM